MLVMVIRAPGQQPAGLAIGSEYDDSHGCSLLQVSTSPAPQRRSSRRESDMSGSAGRRAEPPGDGVQVEDPPASLIEADHRQDVAAAAGDHASSPFNGERLEEDAC